MNYLRGKRTQGNTDDDSYVRADVDSSSKHASLDSTLMGTCDKAQREDSSLESKENDSTKSFEALIQIRDQDDHDGQRTMQEGGGSGKECRAEIKGLLGERIKDLHSKHYQGSDNFYFD